MIAARANIFLLSTASVLMALTGAASGSAADPSAEAFYKTHTTLTMGVPAGAGAAYDNYTRLLARHLPKYIPGNPSIIVDNLNAAGGLVLTNQLYNSAPKDGTFIALVRGSTVQSAVNGNPAAKFDGRKFAWIGNMNQDHDTCIVSSDSAIRSISDLYAHQVIVGASGVGAQSYTFPIMYDALLHMKFKVITGYRSSPARILAMQRGELTGNCGIDTSAIESAFTAQFREKTIRLILQAGLHKDARFPDVPNVLDQAKTTADHQVLEYMFSTLELGRPFATAGETPKDRVALLRHAFDQAMKDPGLIEEAGKLHLDIDTMNGEETAKEVDRLYATPRSVIDRVQAILNATP